MTYQIYSQQQLQLKSIARLKQIYSEIGCTVEVQDKRCKDAWISAIVEHQASKVQKVADVVEEQAIAQAELEQHIAIQAQAVAPEPLKTVEISFYDHEFYTNGKLVAAITHDNDLTQPWVVMVNGKEVHRANTWSRCHRYITWHHQDGTLNEELPTALNQTETTLLAPEPELPTTGNEVMAQIFNECEKFGFDIFDDGIYRENIKLGEVGCTDGNWWVMRAGESQEKIPCDSALDAVWWLSMVDVVPLVSS
ncbi:hypothetical protein FNW02_34715 [Komarekiella sp. 'clone 1']|uniref:Uncharacterized protein n=1 Tax=Komarekiella delphini-convector SJRDD-AB1 TaxID=2593771 RepID=A0AA40VV35_9NOST|nr:hypothetical protein [Komarekiella delphini-convector]MBD6620775.1 hypothetical protein [Komarekiella delphini-convector SJRDD-AB1]